MFVLAGVQLECRERHLLIAVDLSFTGAEPRFEAVGKPGPAAANKTWSEHRLSGFLNSCVFGFADDSGVYPLNDRYAAECGYTFGILPLQSFLELRASYLSCHTENKVQRLYLFIWMATCFLILKLLKNLISG